jgi:glycosyltransferase 2 family protein
MKGERRRLIVFLGVLSSALFIALAVRHLELADVRSALESARLWPFVPLAVLSYLIGHLVRGVRCRLLVSREARLGLPTATNVVVVGYAVNNVLPARLGELARAGMLAQTSGLPFVHSLSVTFLERILDGLSLLLLLVAAGAMLPEIAWIGATLRVGAIVFGAAALCVLCAVIAPSAILSLVSRAAQLLGARVHDLLVGAFSQLVAGVSYLRSAPSAASVAALSVLVWICEAGMFLALLPAFGLAADPWLALAAMCITNLGILAPSTPGFIGPFHFFCMSTLAAVGVAEPVAFGYAVLVHLSFYVPITLWGVGIAFTYGISFGEMVSRAKQARPLGAEPRRVATLRPARAECSEPTRATIALCEALLPPDEDHEPEVVRDVARFVQEETGDLPGRLAWLFAIGLLGFRVLGFLRFLRPLERVPLAKRRLWVERWAYGGVAPARQLLRAVRSTALLAYYEHDRVRAQLLPALISLEPKPERAHGEA